MNLVNSSDGSVLQNISLIKNPTATRSVLSIKGFTLNFGFYEVIYHVYQIHSPISSSVSKTYLRIIPSGIAVFGLRNGVREVQIGSEQSLIILPSNYSRDLDSFISPYSLDFNFFCRIIYPNRSYPAYHLSFSNFNLSLLAIRNNLDLPLNINNTCFSSRGIFYFIL
jgi:hypothetical protein